MTQPASVSRRHLLQLLALAPAIASRVPDVFAEQGRSAAAGGKAPDKIQVGLVSRHLQWTNLEDAIDLARQLG